MSTADKYYWYPVERGGGLGGGSVTLIRIIKKWYSSNNFFIIFLKICFVDYVHSSLERDINSII